MSYYRMHAMVMNATNWRRDIKRKKNKKGDDIARNFMQLMQMQCNAHILQLSNIYGYKQTL